MNDYDEGEGSINASDMVDQGKRVFSMFWDTGDPGGGADYDFIYEYQGAYYHVFLYEEVSGPYVSLEEAVENHELGMINNATKQFETVITAEELLLMLYSNLDPSDLPYPFEINDEARQVNPDGTITSTHRG